MAKRREIVKTATLNNEYAEMFKIIKKNARQNSKIYNQEIIPKTIVISKSLRRVPQKLGQDRLLIKAGFRTGRGTTDGTFGGSYHS